MTENVDLTAELKSAVLASGIDMVGVASIELPEVRQGVCVHSQPRTLMSEARAVIITGFCVRYEPKPIQSQPGIPRGLLPPCGSRAFKQMDAHCHRTVGGFLRKKGFRIVDGSQISIKPAVVGAGLGYYGKHSVVVTRDLGSWVMFSCFVTDAPLAVQDCSPYGGTGCPDGCDLCAKACPTAAIAAPYCVEPSRCVTHWLWGNFAPPELRSKQENRLFGCGECLSVCPKNRHVELRRSYPVPIDELDDGPELLPLLRADNEYFKRAIPSFALDAGIEAIRGNAIIALGNIGDPVAVKGLGFTLRHGIPQNRAYSAWALGRIGGKRVRHRLERALSEEGERSVLIEIKRGLDSASE